MKSKVVLLLPIRCLFFATIYLIMLLVTRKNLSDLAYTWSVVASIVNLFVIALLIIMMKKKNSSYLELITRNQKLNLRM